MSRSRNFTSLVVAYVPFLLGIILLFVFGFFIANFLGAAHLRPDGSGLLRTFYSRAAPRRKSL